jgi:hypothetical protein
MDKESLSDQLRTYLEGVENYWLTFMIIMITLGTIAGLTLVGVYFYTHR